MSRILLGTICGLVYGALSAASMIPLSFTDKTAALAGCVSQPLRHRLCHRRGPFAIAVLGSRTRLRDLAKSAGRHHHQSLRTDPDPRRRRWSDHRGHRWQVGCVSSASSALMQMDISQRVSSIKQALAAKSDEKAKAAVGKFIPTSSAQHVYGVRLPLLNQIAKEHREGGFELAEARSQKRRSSLPGQTSWSNRGTFGSAVWLSSCSRTS